MAQIKITKEDFENLTLNQALERRDEPGHSIEYVELDAISINKLTWLEDGEEISAYWILEI